MSHTSQKVDVVIIGAGIAGVSAAYAASQHHKSVVLVSAHTGLSALVGGTWLSTTTRAAAGLGIDEIRARVIEDDIIAKLGAYDPPRASKACLVASTEGGLIECGSKQKNVLDLADLTKARIAVCEFSPAHLPNAESLSKSLAWQIGQVLGNPAQVHAFTVALNVGVTQPGDSLEWARALDDPQRQQALIADLQKQKAARPFDALLMPPVLGFSDHNLAARISQTLGIPVGELSAWGPSNQCTQSARLDEALVQLLGRSVSAHMKTQVTALQIEGDNLMLTLTDSSMLQAHGVVLATGRLVSRGLEQNTSTVFEPLTGLDATAPSGLFMGEPFRRVSDRAPFRATAGIGLKLNEHGALCSQEGRVFHERVFGAGSLLRALNPALPDGSLGACAVSGYLAGQRAALS